jgi:SNF2 family DNA or RNA helicase
VSFFDLPLIDQLTQDSATQDWPRYRAVFDGFNTLDSFELKLPRLGVTLRDYQLAGVKWLSYLYDNSLGGCLADDMGLGKTIQAIALLSRIYHSQAKKTKPSLVVVPKSLLFN